MHLGVRDRQDDCQTAVITKQLTEWSMVLPSAHRPKVIYTDIRAFYSPIFDTYCQVPCTSYNNVWCQLPMWKRPKLNFAFCLSHFALCVPYLTLSSTQICCVFSPPAWLIVCAAAAHPTARISDEAPSLDEFERVANLTNKLTLNC